MPWHGTSAQRTNFPKSAAVFGLGHPIWPKRDPSFGWPPAKNLPTQTGIRASRMITEITRIAFNWRTSNRLNTIGAGTIMCVADRCISFAKVWNVIVCSRFEIPVIPLMDFDCCRIPQSYRYEDSAELFYYTMSTNIQISLKFDQ